jgi:hypothetical protein
MDARSLTVALLLAACGGCATSSSPPATLDAADGGRHFLRGAQCLDPGMARSWIDLDSNTLLVDAGRYKYRIEVSSACTAMDWSQMLVFRGDPVSGRVCGTLGDAILTRDYPCTIQGMELLDKAQYKALVEENKAGRKRKPSP